MAAAAPELSQGEEKAVTEVSPDKGSEHSSNGSAGVRRARTHLPCVAPGNCEPERSTQDDDEKKTVECAEVHLESQFRSTHSLSIRWPSARRSTGFGFEGARPGPERFLSGALYRRDSASTCFATVAWGIRPAGPFGSDNSAPSAFQSEGPRSKGPESTGEDLEPTNAVPVLVPGFLGGGAARDGPDAMRLDEVVAVGASVEAFGDGVNLRHHVLGQEVAEPVGPFVEFAVDEDADTLRVHRRHPS